MHKAIKDTSYKLDPVFVGPYVFVLFNLNLQVVQSEEILAHQISRVVIGHLSESSFTIEYNRVLNTEDNTNDRSEKNWLNFLWKENNFVVTSRHNN